MLEMGMVHKFGLMGPSTKVSGNKIRQMVLVNLYMLTVIFMKENGKTIWLMVTVYINILKDLNTKEIGLMTSNMDSVLNIGLMVHSMKENFILPLNRVKENMFGVVVKHITVIGCKIRFLVLEQWFGLMVKNMKENSIAVHCTDEEFIFGLTDESIRDSILEIKNM